MQLKAKLREIFICTRSRGSLITAAVVTAVLLAGVLFATGSYLENPTALRVLLYIGCCIAPFIVGALIAFRIRWNDKILSGCFNTVLFFLLPVVTTTMTEALNNVFVYDMTYFGFGANYVVVLLLMALVYAISGSFRLPILIVNPLLFALAVVNQQMMTFRGTPFVPIDIITVTVAENILTEYTYTLSYQLMTAIILLAFLIVVGVRMETPRLKTIWRVIARVIGGIAVVCVMVVFFFTDTFAKAGMKPDFWNQARGYRAYGFTYSFFLNTKYLYVLEPTGYDADAVEGYVQSTIADEQPTVSSGVQPDIICIMNESLADLSVLGDVYTNQDPLPFISSLTENTVRGNLYVPVIGAGTSNTEFEFLTGNSTAFFPSGSNAYVLYVKQQLPTIATIMQQQGYYVTSMHPYYRTGWDRYKVYPKLGFPIFHSIETMLDMYLFDKYKQSGYDIDYLDQLAQQWYPEQNVLMRQYVSDEYNYNWIIRDYIARDTSKPYFMFNVTMQNHGGYRVDASNFPQDVWLDFTDRYDETDRYLSLIKHSDDAFRRLVSYFSSVDRPVMICMFGDHQPSIERRFVEETLGTPIEKLTIQQQQQRHITPFLIWANFDIEEKQIEALSSNYLSSLLLETAGLEMSDYNRYLLKLSETLPVIDTVGLIDKDGEYYSWEQSTPYDEMLEQYRHVQYNAVLDKGNRKEELFSVQ